MNLNQLKTKDEMKLEGIEVTLTLQEKKLVELKLKDSKGKTIVVKRGGTYSEDIAVFEVQDFELEERYVLRGTFAGITKVRELFDDKYEADERLRKYKEKAIVGTELAVKKVKVKVLDTGRVEVLEVLIDNEEIPF